MRKTQIGRKIKLKIPAALRIVLQGGNGKVGQCHIHQAQIESKVSDLRIDGHIVRAETVLRNAQFHGNHFLQGVVHFHFDPAGGRDAELQVTQAALHIARNALQIQFDHIALPEQRHVPIQIEIEI